ncbi:heavy-metal-associated domain-containing protein [Moorella sulfitireducens]|uniref:heavy-metal-associated domain-containing protein n=1 Tax=Neomoorella sulfitireducens TaxID=2972948 RepID=UPI0021AD1975|nr:heavy-metal-associated domain-containing protein [Moorella sulfitireducens]
MSWYSQRAAEILTGRQGHSWRDGYTPDLRQVTITLIVSNMRTGEDARKISNALHILPGVVSVNVILERRWVVVTYYLPRISLEIIGEQITKLGYHFIHKS